MLLESFMLMRKYNELKEKKDSIEKYQNQTATYSDGDFNAKVEVGGLGTVMIVIIILAVVTFVLSIWAIVDAARNCREQALLHILLLIFVPVYLPVYFVLRVSGNVCTLQY